MIFYLSRALTCASEPGSAWCSFRYTYLGARRHRCGRYLYGYSVHPLAMWPTHSGCQLDFDGGTQVAFLLSYSSQSGLGGHLDMCQREIPPKNRRGLWSSLPVDKSPPSAKRNVCPPRRKTLRAPRIAAPSPLTHCRTRARASAAPNDAHTGKKSSRLQRRNLPATPRNESRQAHYRARAPRPARRRWRRSVRTGVYVGRASRLRRRASRLRRPRVARGATRPHATTS